MNLSHKILILFRVELRIVHLFAEVDHFLEVVNDLNEIFEFKVLVTNVCNKIENSLLPLNR